MCIKVSWLKKNSVDILYFYEESPTLKNLNRIKTSQYGLRIFLKTAVFSELRLICLY